MLKLRKKMQENSFETNQKLSQNHRNRFKSKLNKELHKKLYKNRLLFKIAASVLILLSVGYFIKGSFKNTNQVVKKPTLSINDLSPELGKIESYYITAINYELANLPLSANNKIVINTYLDKIEILSKQYKKLNNQLLKGNFNEKLINNLIDNLQLRLQLLLELKTQLNKTKFAKHENSI